MLIRQKDSKINFFFHLRGLQMYLCGIGEDGVTSHTLGQGVLNRGSGKPDSLRAKW